MRTCEECGAPGPESATRCARCGEPLAVGGKSAKRGLEQAPPGSTGMHEPWLWQPSQIGRRAPTTRSLRSQPRYFLVPALGDPFRLDARAGVELVLGRDDGCDVLIRSPSVSRRHARIRFEGSPVRAFIQDLGTVNGTRVNGRVIQGEQPLTNKDTIRVGDVTATYRILDGGVATATIADEKPGRELLDATVPLVSEHHPTKVWKGDLSGDISLYPMPELLARLKMLQVNGTFVVEVDGLEGLARFEQGNVVEAILGEIEGQRAYDAMAALRRGRFRFVPQALKTTGAAGPTERLNRTPPEGASV